MIQYRSAGTALVSGQCSLHSACQGRTLRLLTGGGRLCFQGVAGVNAIGLLHTPFPPDSLCGLSKYSRHMSEQILCATLQSHSCYCPLSFSPILYVCIRFHIKPSTVQLRGRWGQDSRVEDWDFALPNYLHNPSVSISVAFVIWRHEQHELNCAPSKLLY